MEYSEYQRGIIRDIQRTGHFPACFFNPKEAAVMEQAGVIERVKVTGKTPLETYDYEAYRMKGEGHA